MKSYTFPIMNPFTKEWFIDNQDGTFRTISNEQYEKEFVSKFKTRYNTPEKQCGICGHYMKPHLMCEDTDHCSYYEHD